MKSRLSVAFLDFFEKALGQDAHVLEKKRRKSTFPILVATQAAAAAASDATPAAEVFDFRCASFKFRTRGGKFLRSELAIFQSF